MQLLVCCTLFLLFSIRFLYGSKLHVKRFIVSDDHNGNIRECLDTLIRSTNWVVNNFLVISEDMNTVDYKLIQRYPNFAWKLYSVERNNLTGFFNVIFFANTFHNLNAILTSVNIQGMDSRVKFVISVSENFTSLDEIRIASKDIPAAMWRLDKTRVVYLVPCNENILAMTYFPFVRNCQVGELEVLDIWRNKHFMKGTELFPEKMLDIHGCVQNHTVAFARASALQLQQEYAETGEMILGGIGGRLMTMVAEKMNMKLNSVIQPPRSWLLISSQVARGDSLFVLSGTLFLDGQSEVLDLDSGYMEESLGFGYTVRDFEVSWKSLIRPLSMEVWQYTGYIGLLFGGLIFMANRCHRSKIPYRELRILDSFGIFLGTAQVLPRSYFGRYLFGMWIVYSYLINASYNSGFVSFLTSPNEQRVINTLEDLLADGIDFGGSQVHREFYHDPSDPVMMKIYDNFRIWTPNESSRLLEKKQCALNFFKTYVDMYNSNRTDNADHQIRLLKEKAFTFQVPISMRRGSPFVAGVRRYTSRAIQGGFRDYWFKYYTRKSISAGNSPDSPSVISMQHIREILYLYIVGLLFSCVVCLGELIFYKHFSIEIQM